MSESNFQKMVEAGYLTVYSKKTKTRFCYNIYLKRDTENMYFVGLHNELTTAVKFPFLGSFIVRENGQLGRFNAGTKVDKDLFDKQIKTFNWLLQNLETLDQHPTLEYSFTRYYGVW